jgi:hypothetical protein
MHIVSIFHSQEATEQSFVNSCLAKSANNATAVNDFAKMIAL